MPIISEVSPQDTQDLESLKKTNEQGERTAAETVERYLRHITALLESVGIKDAVVSFLHSKEHLVEGEEHIVRGATRVPLLITTETGKYIFKRYDQYDPQAEKEMITLLQDSLAPKALVMGKTLLIEEYLDPSVYIPLPEVFHENEEEALELIAQTFANLAKKKIHFSHQHYFDELRCQKETHEIKATDLGSCHRFYKKGEGETFNSFVNMLNEKKGEESLEEILNIFPFIRNLELGEPEKHKQMQEAFLSFSKTVDAETFMNIVFVLSTAVNGLKRFYEKDLEKHPNPWQEASLNFDKIYQPFFKEYSQK